MLCDFYILIYVSLWYSATWWCYCTKCPSTTWLFGCVDCQRILLLLYWCVCNTQIIEGKFYFDMGNFYLVLTCFILLHLVSWYVSYGWQCTSLAIWIGSQEACSHFDICCDMYLCVHCGTSHCIVRDIERLIDIILLTFLPPI